MIVACDAKNGQVVGFVEVDARPLVGNRNSVTENESSPKEGTSDILRSYMYNLAVDKKWKRKGIASALVQACELFVLDMHDLCVEKRLYLRVRKSNRAAIALYESLGYREMPPEVIHMSKEDINRGSLEDGELILFAKDLPMDGECLLDNIE
jgi:ribosomal protein S18 acetylase RimI-like enzyme